jgi:hypothetical protein
MAPKRKRSHHSNLKSLSDPIGKKIFIYPRAKKVGGRGGYNNFFERKIVPSPGWDKIRIGLPFLFFSGRYNNALLFWSTPQTTSSNEICT